MTVPPPDRRSRPAARAAPRAPVRRWPPPAGGRDPRGSTAPTGVPSPPGAHAEGTAALPGRPRHRARLPRRRAQPERRHAGPPRRRDRRPPPPARVALADQRSGGHRAAAPHPPHRHAAAGLAPAQPSWAGWPPPARAISPGCATAPCCCWPPHRAGGVRAGPGRLRRRGTPPAASDPPSAGDALRRAAALHRARARIAFAGCRACRGHAGRGGTTRPHRAARRGARALPGAGAARLAAASDTRFGPVFRKVDRWGNVEHRALGPDAVRRILARRSRAACAAAGPRHDAPASRGSTQGTAAAADALLDWLHSQSARQPRERPPGSPPRSAKSRRAAQGSWAPHPSRTCRRIRWPATATTPRSATRVRRPLADTSGTAAPGAHRLAASSPDHQRPAGAGGGARTAAAGAGVIPWQLDLDRLAEDLFLLLAARHRRSRAASASPAHASLPANCATPWPAATRWRSPGSAAAGPVRSTCTRCCRCRRPCCAAVRTIRRRWPGSGPTGAPPRRCAMSAPSTRRSRTIRRRSPGEAVFRVTFWSADWTPWRALAALAAQWPALRFALRPRYATP